MTVDFHKSRDGSGPVIARLDHHAVQRLNKLLSQTGRSLSIDPYGDTKLLDAQIKDILALSQDDLDVNTRLAFEKLAELEVVYAIGD